MKLGSYDPKLSGTFFMAHGVDAVSTVEPCCYAVVLLL